MTHSLVVLVSVALSLLLANSAYAQEENTSELVTTQTLDLEAAVAATAPTVVTKLKVVDTLDDTPLFDSTAIKWFVVAQIADGASTIWATRNGSGCTESNLRYYDPTPSVRQMVGVKTVGTVAFLGGMAFVKWMSNLDMASRPARRIVRFMATATTYSTTAFTFFHAGRNVALCGFK